LIATAAKQAARSIKLSVAEKRAVRNGTVHLQGSKQFTIVVDNIRRAKLIQAKEFCAAGNRGKIGGMVTGKGKERNQVAVL